MQTVEQKKIVIKLPHFDLRFFLSFRFFLFLLVVLSSILFAYWFYAIRPYFWISSARVEAFSSLIKSEREGKLTEIGPEEGVHVEQGTPLFSLDQDLLAVKLFQMEHSLKMAHQQIEHEKEEVGRAMEGYLMALSEVELGLGSKETVQKQLNVMTEAQNKSEAALLKEEHLKKEKALLETELKKSSFFAPFTGVILKRFKEKGDLVLFGDPIYHLCDLNRLWIETEVPETKISQISLGTAARVKIAAYPQKEWAGKVCYIGFATSAKSSLLPFSQEAKDAQEATVPVRISLEKGSIPLRPGLSAQVAFKVR